LTKVEEILGSDIMEDERIMTTTENNIFANSERHNRAKLNLIQLVKTGNHLSKRKQKKIEQDIYLG